MNTISAMLIPVVLSGIAAAHDVGPIPGFDPSPVVDTIYGVRVADPYRALEDANDPKVTAWIDAQNKRTRAYLDNLPNYKVVSDRLGRLMHASWPYFSDLQAQGQRIFAIYNDPGRQQPALVTLDASADPSTLAMLVDPNVLDRNGHTAIDWYVASPDGTKVAVSLSRNGTEDGTLHLYEVATNREIETPIPLIQYPTAGGDVCWTEDSAAIWYTRYPGVDAAESERHFNIAVYYHRLGTSVDEDSRVLSVDNGLPRLAEVFFDHHSGGGAVLASVQLGDSGRWQHFILRPARPALKIARYQDEIAAATIAPDGTVFGVSRLGSPMGRVLKLASPFGSGFDGAKTVIGERRDAAITTGGWTGSPLAFAGERLFVKHISGGPIELTSYRLNGTDPRPIALPPQAAAKELVPLPGGDLIYSVSAYLEPTYYAHWKASDGSTVRTQLTQRSAVSFGDIGVTRVFAASKDGTKVPVSIFAKKGAVRDGRAPTLLYGYGAFGLSTSPKLLSAFHRLWFDAGGIYAIANIRGGGEYGESWHRGGALTHKQKGLDDFAAAANTLINRGYTNATRMAFMGGSAGGLLMGAMITQHPQLVRAVVSSVGLYDMMRFERGPNGEFVSGEFGSTANPVDFRALYAYSPYHHVSSGMHYPAVLMLTGANDSRVDPFHSRKFTAALQAVQSDHPVLLYTSTTAGHGSGTAMDERIQQATDQLLFLFDQLGMNQARHRNSGDQ